MSALLHHRKALLGMALLASFLLLAAFGPLLVGDPTAFVGLPLEPPSPAHWLGTTGLGQDVLAQIVTGTRPTLVLGFAVGICVVLLGALVGTAAGYFGGWVDDVLSLLINVFLVMPGLPLMVVAAAYLPSGQLTMAIVLVVAGWAWSARVFRVQTQSLRGRDFVLAALVGGESHLRILVCEIGPHLLSLLASAVAGATIYAIAAEVGLEFLGIGDAGRVTWGSILYWARNDAALLTGSWWTFVPAGVCLGLVGFALALLNGAFDEVGNPRLRAERDRPGRGRATLPGAATPVYRRRPTRATRERHG